MKVENDVPREDMCKSSNQVGKSIVIGIEPLFIRALM